MANLETLELTINGSADKAAGGIDNLITKLSGLSTALIKPYSDLRDFNAELKRMKEYCAGIKFPNIAKATNASRAVAKTAARGAKGGERGSVLNEFKDEYRKGTFASWMYGPRPPIKVTNTLGFTNGYKTDAERRAKNPQWYVEPGSQQWKDNIAARNEALKNQTKAIGFKNDDRPLAENGVAIKNLSEYMYKYSEATQEAKEKTGSFSNAITAIKNGVKGIKEGLGNALSGVNKLFQRVKQIATRMLIRSAIRGVISSLKQGVSNLYEWSKTVNGSFADSVKSMKASALTLKNSLGAMIGPVIQALIPLFNSLSSAIITAANWLNQFISLLSGKTSWTMATEQQAENMDNLADSTSNAGKAAKETLAAFDELNVLNNGGGSGSNTTTVSPETDYGSMFTEIDTFDKKIRDLTDFIRENLETIKGLAIAAGTALLAWDLGQSFKSVLPTLSTILGYVGTGAAIALTVSLDWLFQNQYLDTGEEGWLWAAVLSTAVGSTVAGTIAKSLIGGTAGYYAAAITLELTAAADVIANLEHTDVSALSQESILTNIKAAIEAGAGIALVEAASGASFSAAITAAGGGALIVFGVAMGLKTVFDKTNTEWDSKETIVGAITAAIPVGLGLFVLGAGGIPAAIAAIATFGVVVALKASVPKSKIKWGEIELTDEQVQEYVKTQMFEIDVPATVGIIADQVEMNITERAKIGVELAKLLPIYNLIKLGIATDQDYAMMKTQLNTVIDTVNGFIAEARKTGALSLEYIPTLAGDDSVSQGTWFTQYNQGWDAIEEFVNKKGKQIGEWLTEQEKKEIKDATPDVIKEAMDQLTAVTNALAQARINANAFADFNINFGNITLGDVTEETFGKITEQFTAYREQLRTEYTALANEQYALQAELVAGLLEAYGEDNPQYKEALAKLKEMGENMPKAIEDGVNAASQSGTNLIMDWLNDQIGGTVDSWDWADAFERTGIASAEDMQGALRQVLESTLTEEQINLADMVGFTGWDLLSDELKRGFIDNVNLFDPEQIDWLKQSGIPVSEIIYFSGWTDLEESERKQLVTTLTNAFGSQEAIAEIKKAIPNISADGLIKMTDWDSVADKEGFIEAMKKEFGEADTIAALKQIGVDVSTNVQAGLNSNEPVVTVGSVVKPGQTGDDILKQYTGKEATISVGSEVKAGQTGKDVADSFSAQTPSMTVTPTIPDDQKPAEIAKTFGEVTAEMGVKAALDNESVNDAKTAVENVSPEMKAKLQKISNKEAKKFVETVDEKLKKKKATINAQTKLDEDSTPEEIKRKFEALNPKVTVNGEILSTFPTEVGNKVAEAIKAKLNKSRVTVNGQGQLTISTTNVNETKGVGEEVIDVKLNVTNFSDIGSSIGTAAAKYVKSDINKITSDGIAKFGAQVGNSAYKYVIERVNWIDSYDIRKFTGAAASGIYDKTKSKLNSVDQDYFYNFAAWAGYAVKEGIKAYVNALRFTFTAQNGVATLTAAAGGGLVTSGDIFIANENGKSEMIGRFGNQTGVANQEQMVEAMARGVAYAQESQNALLREQNNLLRGILQKDNTMRLAASSALGRTVRQSLNMYESLVGG